MIELAKWGRWVSLENIYISLYFPLILIRKGFKVFTDRATFPEICLYSKTLLFIICGKKSNVIRAGRPQFSIPNPFIFQLWALKKLPNLAKLLFLHL